MGAQPHQEPDIYQLTMLDIQQIYSQHYGVQTPIESGYKIPEMFDAAISGKLKSMGLSVKMWFKPIQIPKVIKALKNLDLLIVQELFMTEPANWRDVVLPASSFLKTVHSPTVKDGFQAVHQAVQPLAERNPMGKSLSIS